MVTVPQAQALCPGWAEGRSVPTVIKVLERLEQGGVNLTAESPAVVDRLATEVMITRRYWRSGWLPPAAEVPGLLQVARDQVAQWAAPCTNGPHGPGETCDPVCSHWTADLRATMRSVAGSRKP